jgi:hypothetical protein
MSTTASTTNILKKNQIDLSIVAKVEMSGKHSASAKNIG